jgi:hypothetical protein
MRVEFRTGWFAGLVLALTIGLYCVWLWQPPRQIDRHTKNLLHDIEQRNWSRVADLIGTDYADQWGNDRALVLERMRLVLGYGHHLGLKAVDPNCKIDNGGRVGLWRGRIVIENDGPELGGMVKERVNALTTPFELQWRHISGKPWDWKLVRVSNQELEIPAEFD